MPWKTRQRSGQLGISTPLKKTKAAIIDGLSLSFWVVLHAFILEKQRPLMVFILQCVIDISIGKLKHLPKHENREVQRMLKLLQAANREVMKESIGGEKTVVLGGCWDAAVCHSLILCLMLSPHLW